MIEIGITGAKNAGKTTLMVELIQRLAETGARVATVKHTGHGHTFDTDGKDSHCHRQAGAGLTVAVSTAETAVFADPDTNLYEKLRPTLHELFDWLLVEGDKLSRRPKVFLTNSSENLKGPLPENIIATYGDDVISAEVPHFSRGDAVGLLEFLKKTLPTLGQRELDRA